MHSNLYPGSSLHRTVNAPQSYYIESTHYQEDNNSKPQEEKDLKIKNLQRAIKTLEEENNRLKKNNHSLKKRNINFETSLSSRGNDLRNKDMREENHVLRHKLQQMEIMNKELNERVNGFSRENYQSQFILNEERSALQQKTKQIGRLNEEIEQLTSQIISLKQQAKSSQKMKRERDDLMEQSRKLKTKIDKQNKKINYLKDKLSDRSRRELNNNGKEEHYRSKYLEEQNRAFNYEQELNRQAKLIEELNREYKESMENANERLLRTMIRDKRIADREKSQVNEEGFKEKFELERRKNNTLKAELLSLQKRLTELNSIKRSNETTASLQESNTEYVVRVIPPEDIEKRLNDSYRSKDYAVPEFYRSGVLERSQDKSCLKEEKNIFADNNSFSSLMNGEEDEAEQQRYYDIKYIETNKGSICSEE